MPTFVRRPQRHTNRQALQRDCKAYKSAVDSAAKSYDMHNSVAGEDARICWARLVSSDPLLRLDGEHRTYIVQRNILGNKHPDAIAAGLASQESDFPTARMRDETVHELAATLAARLGKSLAK